MFIVFEGIDGSGKSTQARLLHSLLVKNGIKCQMDHEPTDKTEAGRRLLKSKAFRGTGIELSGKEELALFLQDREEHVEKFIKPWLADSSVVILDRYDLSTYCYQVVLGSLTARNAMILHSKALRPDITFILDIPIWLALRRIEMVRKKSFYEREELLSEVLLKYREFAMDENSFFIPSEQQIEEVHEKVVEILKLYRLRLHQNYQEA